LPGGTRRSSMRAAASSITSLRRAARCTDRGVLHGPDADRHAVLGSCHQRSPGDEATGVPRQLHVNGRRYVRGMSPRTSTVHASEVVRHHDYGIAEGRVGPNLLAVPSSGGTASSERRTPWSPAPRIPCAAEPHAPRRPPFPASGPTAPRAGSSPGALAFAPCTTSSGSSSTSWCPVVC
jgi:hypothetical protein